MSTSPAVCPLCARVQEFNPQELPEVFRCEGCGAELKPCAHGVAVMLEEVKAGPPSEKPDVEALLERAAKERKPDRAYKLIQQALEIAPDSFAANRALLYHGRLHETTKRPGDYTLVKCYLFHMFEEPGKYTPAQLDAMAEELFHDPQLARTAALSGDEAAFLTQYARHLAGEYLRVFVRGRSSVGRMAFGIPRPDDSTRKLCGQIVAGMERNLRAESRISELERELLSEALARGLDTL